MPDRPKRLSVLFLCTGNSARSQIAEALLAKKGGGRFVVGSAGTEPAPAVRAEAVAALADIGVDWNNHHPKPIEAVAATRWDIVITLCDRAVESCPTLPGRPVTAHWGVPDPAAVDDESRRRQAFKSTVDVLTWRVDLMLALKPESLERLALETGLKDIADQTSMVQTGRG